MEKVCSSCVGIGSIGEADCELCSGKGTRVWLRVTAPDQLGRARKAFSVAEASFKAAMEKVRARTNDRGNSTDV